MQKRMMKKKFKKKMTRLYDEYLSSDPYRPMIEYIKYNMNDKPLIGVEVGVSGGSHARNILKHLNVKHLYLIDPYDEFESYYFKKEYNNFKEQSSKKLHRHRDKITFIYKRSVDAKEDLPDAIDFVYLDGDHSYENVKKEIELFYPKMVEGGVLGGHDFRTDRSTPFGVIQAALEFSDKKNLHLWVGGNKGDWWCIKGDKKIKGVDP